MPARSSPSTEPDLRLRIRPKKKRKKSARQPTGRPGGRPKRAPLEKKLTFMQMRFIEIYAANGFRNALSSAEQAGYSKNNANRGLHVMSNPLVIAELHKRFMAEREEIRYTANQIKGGFSVIAFDPRGVDEGGPTRLERMAALDRLAKLSGLYVNKHVFTGATLEQLLEIAAETEQKMPAAQKPGRLLEHESSG